MLGAVMPASATLTEQLATLGVHLPAWPEELEGDEPGNWIQWGQAYAEGMRLWRAQIRNAPESTKRVLQHFLDHLITSDQLSPWDKWLSANIGLEVKVVWGPDSWEQIIDALRDTPLTRAQILGGLLTLADSQQLGGAITGALRLFRDKKVKSRNAPEVCALLIVHLDSAWRIAEAHASPEAFHDLVDFHLECSKLLAATFEHSRNKAEGQCTSSEKVLASLERLLFIAGEEDKWNFAPKAQTIQILEQSDLETALDFLENNISQSMPKAARKACARMFAGKILAETGKWEQAKDLNDRAIDQLKEYQKEGSMQSFELDVIRTETELLSHELSIALGNRSLEAPNWTQSEGKLAYQSLSRSQLGQDLWVLEHLGWKKGGFFVEFGATDGVLLSNSWLLEKYFDWNGICAEPNPKLFERLQVNRSCTLTPACVYRTSGEIMKFILADAYGGLEGFSGCDQHASKRDAYAAKGCIIEVSTVSLLDLLRQNGAPGIIDYLSIDTEGSELAILQGFDWNAYQIRCITVEHNYAPNRQDIRRLLEGLGYAFHEAKWDDWYFKEI
jgi:FkbM family methyltransferase